MVRSFFSGTKQHSSACGDHNQVGDCVNESAKAVLHLLRRKGPPLSSKQLDYCSELCIERVMKARSNNVKKAAKQLRATLAWRTGLDVDYLTADEFSAELAGGNAYVAGLDEDGRPVLIVKLRPEITSTNQAQKQFIRYFVFTMEVAIACMPSLVEQFVLIVDAAACQKRSSTGFSNLTQLLKLLGEHYPERLARCFIVDAPSIFHYLWKGVSRLLDLKVREKPRFVFSKHYSNSAGTARPGSLVSATAKHLIHAVKSYSNGNSWAASNEQMSDEEEELDQNDDNSLFVSSKTSRNVHHVVRSPALSSSTSTLPLPSLSPFLPSSISTSPACASSPLREVSSSPSPPVLIPSLTSSSPSTSLQSSSSSSLQSSSSCSCASLATPSYPSAAPLHHHWNGGTLLAEKDKGRSLSFALAPTCNMEMIGEFRSFRADSKLSKRRDEDGASRRWADMAFGQRNDDFVYRTDHDREIDQRHKGAALFRPYYVNFLVCGYIESAYRARMKPPLAGLISIISPDIKAQQPSFALHSTAMEAMLHHLHFD